MTPIVDRTRLALELRRARRPLVALVLLVALAIGVGAYIFGHQTFRKPWDDYGFVKVAFSDVKGVLPGKHEVRVAGVPAGVVESAKVIDGRAVLTLAIRRRFLPINRDARIRIRPVTPLEDMYVSIERRGTPAAGRLGPDEVLSGRGVTSPVDVSRVLQVFDADTRVHLHVLLTELGAGLADRGRDLRAAFAQAVPLLERTRTLSDALATRRRELRRVVTQMGTLTATLAAADDQVASLVRRGNVTTRQLADDDGAFSATLAELPAAVAALRTSLRTVAAAEDDIDPALASLRPVADRLERGLTSLDRFARDARPALRRLREPVARLDPLAASLTPTVRSLRSAVAQLQPQAPQLDRITTSFTPCRLAAQKFFNWTLSVFKFSDAFGAFPRGDLTAGANAPGLADAYDDPNLRKTPNCMERSR